MRVTLTAEEASKIAHDAYVFCFPLNYYYRTIYSQIVDPNNKKASTVLQDTLPLPASRFQGKRVACAA